MISHKQMSNALGKPVQTEKCLLTASLVFFWFQARDTEEQTSQLILAKAEFYEAKVFIEG